MVDRRVILPVITVPFVARRYYARASYQCSTAFHCFSFVIFSFLFDKNLAKWRNFTNFAAPLREHAALPAHKLFVEN